MKIPESVKMALGQHAEGMITDRQFVERAVDEYAQFFEAASIQRDRDEAMRIVSGIVAIMEAADARIAEDVRLWISRNSSKNG